MAYTSYTQETVGIDPAASGGCEIELMNRQTLHVKNHSAQVQAPPQHFSQECRRALHGGNAVALRHDQSVTVKRTLRSRAPANYTDRPGFVRRCRQRGQYTHRSPRLVADLRNPIDHLSHPHARAAVHSWLLYLVLCLPRHCSLRLLLFCTCPPLCAVALWPMPAWVWRDVRFVFFSSRKRVSAT